MHTKSRFDYRSKVDLYEYKQIESLIKRVNEELKLDAAGLKRDLSKLVSLLEQHRRKVLLEKKPRCFKYPVAVCLTIANGYFLHNSL